jgi:small-conductance mechanosensitive channel
MQGVFSEVRSCPFLGSLSRNFPNMATWQRCLVGFKATLTSKMPVLRDEDEPIEVVLRELLAMPLVPGPAQRDAVARLQSQLEEALGTLDDLERSRDLSAKERQQLEALQDLRSALEKLG